MQSPRPSLVKSVAPFRLGNLDFALKVADKGQTASVPHHLILVSSLMYQLTVETEEHSNYQFWNLRRAKPVLTLD